MKSTKEEWKQKSLDFLSAGGHHLVAGPRHHVMRSLNLALLLPVVILLSCSTEDVLSIQIKNAIGNQPDENCIMTTGSTMQKARGSLNFFLPEYLGNYPQYILALAIKSSLEAEEATAGDITVQPSSRNDFYLSEMVLTYECKDEASRCRDFPSIPAQSTPLAGTVFAGGELALGVQLFTTTSAEMIGAFLSEGDGMNVNVKVKLKGKFANGSKKEVPEFTFPLFLERTAVTVKDRAKYNPAVFQGSKGPACLNWGQDSLIPDFVCRSDCGGGCGANAKCDTTLCSCVAK